MNARAHRQESPVSSSPASGAERFNPPLFAFDPASPYAWNVFDRITVATITWNRLALTRRFIESVLRHAHLPHRLLIIDNASTDGTVPWLRDLAAQYPHVSVIENPRNVGLARALLQLRDLVDDGLVVYCDNDMEVLTNYWLVLVMKAFHAVRLGRGSADAVLGPRVINLDEYGFRYASRREVLAIPADRNSEPRTSYAAVSKDDPAPAGRLREEVVIGWTEYMMGGAQAMPASVLRRIPLEECYPLYIGGTDAFMSAELLRMGVPMGYIENGPVVRHNDWPYTEEKMRDYLRLTTTRSVTDVAWARWKLRGLRERFLGR